MASTGSAAANTMVCELAAGIGGQGPAVSAVV